MSADHGQTWGTRSLRMESDLSLLRVVLVLLLIIFLAEELGPEAVLLLFLVLILVGGLVLSLGWLHGYGLRLLLLRRGGLLRDARRLRPLGSGALSESEDLLEDVALIAYGVITGVGGLGTVQEGGGVVLGASSVGEQIGGAVELHLNNPGRGDKIFGI